MTRKYDSILETVGNTPVIRINKLAPKGVNLYVKAEAFNPMGSIKDRLALGVIEHAERTGQLKPGQTVIEATSGNTGIGLAMVCAQKGYPLVIVMAESFSLERRRLMRFLGAKVVLTPAAEKGTGMLRKAQELAETHGWFMTRQFENEANADVHSATTAPEILEAFEGEKLDYWVTGFGTGGTLKGVSRVLREQSPETRIVVCEPDNSRLLGSGIRQIRNPDGTPAESHPNFRPHMMQGWVPDFIPKLTEDAVDGELFDNILPIRGDDATYYTRALAQQEGIFVGISAGATFAGALEIARQAPEGANILCMLPDTGERYQSTPLFEDIDVEMNEEEIGISRSTPSCRFDAPPPAAEVKEAKPAPQPAIAAGKPDPEAEAFVDKVLTDPDNPVVMFALEWCEFCWSVRRMFAKCDIPYVSVDLDSAAYQKDEWGGKVRRALNARTGCVTIPQIFVGGRFIGGCTELFDAYKDGSLKDMLKAAGVHYNEELDMDPYEFLPGWLHSRESAA